MVDAGGWAERTNPDRPDLRSRLLLEGLHALGLQVANVASRDLRLGPAALGVLAESTGVQFVSANVRVGGKPPFRPYVLQRRRIGGREVGVAITGVTMSSHEATEAWPDSLGLEFAPPLEAAQQVLAEVEPQSDLRVLLAYVPSTELEKWVDKLPGYDLIVCGTGDLRDNPAVGPTPVLLAPGTKCKFLSWVAVRLTTGSGSTLAAVGIEPLDAKVPDEPRTAERVRIAKQQLGEAGPSATAAPAAPASGAAGGH